jgi:hypothetical protein
MILGGLTLLPHFLQAIGVPMKVVKLDWIQHWDTKTLVYLCHGFRDEDERDDARELHDKFWRMLFQQKEVELRDWGFIITVSYNVNLMPERALEAIGL